MAALRLVDPPVEHPAVTGAEAAVVALLESFSAYQLHAPGGSLLLRQVEGWKAHARAELHRVLYREED